MKTNLESTDVRYLINKFEKCVWWKENEKVDGWYQIIFSN